MGQKKQTVGYRYYLGMHVGICLGPVDELKAIYMGERKAWEGSQTASGELLVDSPNLFGGDEREGGMIAAVDVMMGGNAQVANTYLTTKAGADQPAYRGLLSLVFRGPATYQGQKWPRTGAYLSSMTPYIKPIAAKVKRITSGWFGGTAWYSAKAAIGDNMNPAHIIYQCLTDPDFGLGRPTTDIDTAAFQAAADTLFNEGFGLSIMWTQQEAVEDFIGRILAHIDASLYLDRVTGKFVLKLVRADYDPNTLPEFDSSNATVLDFQRVPFAETVNEVIVKYTDPGTEAEATVSVQDLANIRAQGAVVNQTRDYPGLRSAALAYRVAERDLLSLSTPLAKVTLQANRTGWDVYEGNLVKLTFPDYKMTDAVFRVASVDYGTIDSGYIRMELLEDAFTMPSSNYGGNGQPGQWNDPSALPAVVVDSDVRLATYYELAQELGDDDAEALVANEGYVMATARRPAVQNTLLRVASYPTNLPSQAVMEEGVGYYAPTAQLAAGIGQGDTTLLYSNEEEWDSVAAGQWICVNGEFMEILSIDKNSKSISVGRGCLDTPPTTHSVSSRIWGQSDGLLTEPQPDGVTHNYWVVGTSPSGTAPVATSPRTQVSVSPRHLKPYPPAKVQINGQYPWAVASVTRPITITWAERNRLTSTASLIHWTENSVTSEVGTTYEIQFYDHSIENNPIPVASAIGLTGTEYDLTESLPEGMTHISFHIAARREGYFSNRYQSPRMVLQQVGYGYDYGNNYGSGFAGTVLQPGQPSVPGFIGYTKLEPVGYAPWLDAMIWRGKGVDASGNAVTNVYSSKADLTQITLLHAGADTPLSAGVVTFGSTFACVSHDWKVYRTTDFATVTESPFVYESAERSHPLTISFANGNMIILSPGDVKPIWEPAKGQIYSSTDGITFVPNIVGSPPEPFNTVVNIPVWLDHEPFAFENGVYRFVRRKWVGNSDYRDLYTSPDLKTWSAAARIAGPFAAVPLTRYWSGTSISRTSLSSGRESDSSIAAPYTRKYIKGPVVAISEASSNSGATYTLVDLNTPNRTDLDYLLGTPYSGNVFVVGRRDIGKESGASSWSWSNHTLALFAAPPPGIPFSGNAVISGDSLFLRPIWAKDRLYIGEILLKKDGSLAPASETGRPLLVSTGGDFTGVNGVPGMWFRENIGAVRPYVVGSGTIQASTARAATAYMAQPKRMMEFTISVMATGGSAGVEIFVSTDNIGGGTAYGASAKITSAKQAVFTNAVGGYTYKEARIPQLQANDVVSVYLDASTGEIEFAINGTSVFTATGPSGTWADTGVATEWAVQVKTGQAEMAYNVGQSSFSYPKAGYIGWSS